MSGNGDARQQPDDALALLEGEDRRLIELFSAFERTAGEPAVEDRDAHGVAAKLLVRHVAIWEATREQLAEALQAQEDGDLGPIAERLAAGGGERRQLLDRVEQMNRGLQPMSINVGQDFDAAMAPLRRLIDPEVRWELDDALPHLRSTLSDEARADLLPSARFVRAHAPTNPSPDRTRWYEKSNILTRLRTRYDHLRDHPFLRRWNERFRRL